MSDRCERCNQDISDYEDDSTLCITCEQTYPWLVSRRRVAFREDDAGVFVHGASWLSDDNVRPGEYVIEEEEE